MFVIIELNFLLTYLFTSVFVYFATLQWLELIFVNDVNFMINH